MRAALVQFRSVDDLEENRRRAAEAVAEAAASGHELVVLPEAAQCSFKDPESDLGPVAEGLDGPFVAALAEAAGEATAVAGLFERGQGGAIHNTVVVVDGGGLRASYRKLHLYDALGYEESARLVPGDPQEPPVVVEVGEHRLGVMTCYDLRFPEVARRLAVAGATVVAVPAAWHRGPGKGEQWRVLLQARAAENTTYVLGAAQPPPTYCGLSSAAGPRGEVLAVFEPPTEGTVSVELPFHALVQTRRALPLLRHRRFDVVVRGEPGL